MRHTPYSVELMYLLSKQRSGKRRARRLFNMSLSTLGIVLLLGLISHVLDALGAELTTSWPQG